MKSLCNQWLEENYEEQLKLTVLRTNPQDAQDVFDKAVEGLLSYEGDINDVGKFFHRILHNSITDYYREQSKKKLYEELDSEQATDCRTPERYLSSQQDFEEVAALIMQMDNELHKEVIELLLEGNTYREIADKLDLTYTNVRKIVQRFRELLMKS